MRPLTVTLPPLGGGWPPGGPGTDRDFGERFGAYIAKGISEAKRQTSWINPNSAYEDAIAAFVRSLLDERLSSTFLSSVADFVGRIEMAGFLNSLTQIVLKAATPGVPDDIPVADREQGQEQLAGQAAQAEINAFGSGARENARIRVPDQILNPDL